MNEEEKARLEKAEALIVLLTHTVYQLAEGDEGAWWVNKALRAPDDDQIREAEITLGVKEERW